MSRLVSFLFIIICIVSLLFSVQKLLDYLSLKYLFFDRHLNRAFRSIKVGMSREEVIKRMGKPSREELEFRLGQYDGNEKEYERAKRSSAKTYLFWYTGIDYTYAIGFNEQGKVVFKGAGGT